MNESDKPPEYQVALWVQLNTVINLYKLDREAYWTARLEGEEWSPLKQLRQDADDIAAAIRKRALALRNVVDSSELNAIYTAYRHAKEEAQTRWAEYRSRLRESLSKEQADKLLRQLESILPTEPDPEEEVDTPLRLIWERLCIDDAWDVVDTIPERVRRTLELERLIDDVLGQSHPPEACIGFLSLISRCYIYGFDTECVVMCRSAIDTAFRERVTDEHCQKAHRQRLYLTLSDRIQAAFDPVNNLLVGKPDLYRAAQEVQDRGDKAVHYDPYATKDVLGTIDRALRVVKALSELRDPA